MRLVFYQASWWLRLLRLIQAMYQDNDVLTQVHWRLDAESFALTAFNAKKRLFLELPQHELKCLDLGSIHRFTRQMASPHQTQSFTLYFDHLPIPRLIECLAEFETLMSQKNYQQAGVVMEWQFRVHAQDELRFWVYPGAYQTSTWSLTMPTLQLRVLANDTMEPLRLPRMGCAGANAMATASTPKTTSHDVIMIDDDEDYYAEPNQYGDKSSNSNQAAGKRAVKAQQAQAAHQPARPEASKPTTHVSNYWSDQATCSPHGPLPLHYLGQASQTVHLSPLDLDHPRPNYSFRLCPHELRRLLGEWMILPPTTTLTWHADRVEIVSGMACSIACSATGGSSSGGPANPALSLHVAQCRRLVPYSSGAIKPACVASAHHGLPLTTTLSSACIVDMYRLLSCGLGELVTGIQWSLMAHNAMPSTLHHTSKGLHMQMEHAMEAYAGAPRVMEMTWTDTSA